MENSCTSCGPDAKCIHKIPRSQCRECGAPSAYIPFSIQQRPIVTNDNPGLTFDEIGKKLGEMWRALTDDEKKKYTK